MTDPTLAVIVKGYPRLSETFIAQEIAALERLGFRFIIVSLRHPTDTKRHAVHADIQADILYLPEYLHDEPFRVMRSAIICLRQWRFFSTLYLWLRDLFRDFSPNRVRRFGQALVLAAELPVTVRHLYVHYLHTPGSVGQYCSSLRARTFSISAHARDIWTTPMWELRQKLEAASWTITCTQHNLRFLRNLAPKARIELVYHGLNSTMFPPPTSLGLGRSNGCIIVISVARAVPKKGLDTALTALGMVPDDLSWHFVQVGAGPELERLKQLATELKIEHKITWFGMADHEEVLVQLRRAQIFCLPSRIAEDGDRDGLPNVLLEALSQRLAVVTTGVSAIPELIVDGETGLLVQHDDPKSLADALERLMRDSALRDRLATNGQAKVMNEFGMEHGVARIETLLRAQLV